jgi:hypothetical protein
MNSFSAVKTFDKFKPDCTKAIELVPKNVDACTNRSKAYKAMRKTKEAEADFAKAKQLEK